MDKLEIKAVSELKDLIRKIENGEFKITDCGMNNELEYSNVSTDNGKIKNWKTSYVIHHYEK